MPKLSFLPSSQPDPFQSIRLAILEEHLRQAKLTFNLSAVAIALSLGISITGAALLLNGKTSQGAVTTASGLLSTGFCTQVAKDASEKLGRLTEALKTMQKIEG
jgi:hypothetical protein